MAKILKSIMGNSQRLDGGAMFGNAPKALWARWLMPDNNNQIPLACRALLIQDQGRNILLEAGIGCFFEPALKARYGIVEDEHVLLQSLAEHGLTDADIDIVILSHLHFDHAGGLLSAWQVDKSPQLLFPNATFILSKEAWERASAPHARDRASFIPTLNQQLADSQRLYLVNSEQCELLGQDYRFHYSHGHTPGMLLTEITTEQGPLVFAADLIPGVPWMHVPITMGYDRYPELLIDEKRALLEYLLVHQGLVFFTHDPNVAFGLVAQDSKAKFCIADPFKGG